MRCRRATHRLSTSKFALLTVASPALPRSKLLLTGESCKGGCCRRRRCSSISCCACTAFLDSYRVLRRACSQSQDVVRCFGSLMADQLGSRQLVRSQIVDSGIPGWLATSLGHGVIRWLLQRAEERVPTAIVTNKFKRNRQNSM